jgi:anti-anti-sigma factor
MGRTVRTSNLKVTEYGGTLVVEGDLEADSAGQFESLIAGVETRPTAEVVLDLSGLDIDDGFALATVVNSLRGLRRRAGRLILRGAPQILGHNLYRAGLLGEIELVDMRKDEPGGL